MSHPGVPDVAVIGFLTTSGVRLPGPWSCGWARADLTTED